MGKRSACIHSCEQRQQAEAEQSRKGADGIEVIDVSEHKPKSIPSKHWRDLIKKVWEVDPLLWPMCQSEMKVVALIDCPGLIRYILEHLKLWEPVVSMPQSRSPPPIKEVPEVHLFAGQTSQYALPIYLSAAQADKNAAELEGVDDIPPTMSLLSFKHNPPNREKLLADLVCGT